MKTLRRRIAKYRKSTDIHEQIALLVDIRLGLKAIAKSRFPQQLSLEVIVMIHDSAVNQFEEFSDQLEASYPLNRVFPDPFLLPPRKLRISCNNQNYESNIVRKNI